MWSSSPTLALDTSFFIFLDLIQLDTPHTVELLWMSDQLVAEAATYSTHNRQKRQTTMPSGGFEPAIPTMDWLQTYALGRAATRIRYICIYLVFYLSPYVLLRYIILNMFLSCIITQVASYGELKLTYWSHCQTKMSSLVAKCYITS